MPFRRTTSLLFASLRNNVDRVCQQHVLKLYKKEEKEKERKKRKRIQRLNKGNRYHRGVKISRKFSLGSRIFWWPRSPPNQISDTLLWLLIQGSHRHRQPCFRAAQHNWVLSSRRQKNQASVSLSLLFVNCSSPSSFLPPQRCSQQCSQQRQHSHKTQRRRVCLLQKSRLWDLLLRVQPWFAVRWECIRWVASQLVVQRLETRIRQSRILCVLQLLCSARADNRLFGRMREKAHECLVLRLATEWSQRKGLKMSVLNMSIILQHLLIHTYKNKNKNGHITIISRIDCC